MNAVARAQLTFQMLTSLQKYLHHQSQHSKTWDSKCLTLVAQTVRAIGMNPKVGGSSPLQVEPFLCIKNFDAFTRTPACESKINVVAQLRFQMLTLPQKLLIYAYFTGAGTIIYLHLSPNPQCTIQNKNVQISVMNGALWDMGQVHCGICETGQSHIDHIPADKCTQSHEGLYFSFRFYTAPTTALNTLRPRQNGRHFADDAFKRIFLNENARISIKVSLKFVPKVPIHNIPALVQIMAWRRPGDKPLSEPMMVSLLTHICVTRPQ